MKTEETKIKNFLTDLFIQCLLYKLKIVFDNIAGLKRSAFSCYIHTGMCDLKNRDDF